MKLAITTLHRPPVCRFFQLEHCLQVKFSWANFYDWNFRKEILAPCRKIELATAFNWFFRLYPIFFFSRSQVSNRDTSPSDVRKQKKTIYASILCDIWSRYLNTVCYLFQPTKLNVYKNDAESWDYTTPTLGESTFFSLFHLPQFFFYFLLSVLRSCNFITYTIPFATLGTYVSAIDSMKVQNRTSPFFLERR